MSYLELFVCVTITFTVAWLAGGFLTICLLCNMFKQQGKTYLYKDLSKSQRENMLFIGLMGYPVWFFLRKSLKAEGYTISYTLPFTLGGSNERK